MFFLLLHEPDDDGAEWDRRLLKGVGGTGGAGGAGGAGGDGGVGAVGDVGFGVGRDVGDVNDERGAVRPGASNFGSFGEAFLTLYGMMLGNFDREWFDDASGVSLLLFVIYSAHPRWSRALGLW